MEDKLLKLLRDDHVITAAQYQQVLQECETSGKRSEIILEQLEILHEKPLLEFLGRKFRMPIINWDNYSPNQELLNLIPEDVATKYTVFPYAMEQGKRQGKITLAVADPSNVSASDDISFMTGYAVRTEMASARAIHEAIQGYYRGEKTDPDQAKIQPTSKTQALKKRLPSSEIEAIDSLVVKLAEEIQVTEEEYPDDLAGLDREHPSTKLLFDLLETVVERGFSGIHIEPYEGEQRVRFNWYGYLQKHTLIPNSIGRDIALRLRRILHHTDITTLPKEASSVWAENFFTTFIKGKPLSVIVDFYPTPFGESIRLKIKNGERPTEIEQLGIDKNSLKTLGRMLTKPQGLLLIVGPPKQGKTTTLYAFLRKFHQLEENILSLEAFVETIIPGITQIPFNAQMTYQDWCSIISYYAPHVIALENAENPLISQLAFELSSSALVLTSLTASDFADGLCTYVSTLSSHFREPQSQTVRSLIFDSINGIIYQRLIKTICPNCKEEIKPSEQDIDLFRWLAGTNHDIHDVSAYIGKGCPDCLEKGYRGQTGLFEIIKFDKGLKQLFLQNQAECSFQVRQAYDKISSASMKHQAFQLIHQGITTPAEIRRTMLQQAVGSRQ